MPLYELFCLIRPGLAKAQVVDILKKAGDKVYKAGGVVTDVKSYGERPLAYTIQKDGTKYGDAQIMQLDFLAGPKVISEMDFNLKVDENVLRWNFLRGRDIPRLPTRREAKRILYQEKKAAEADAAAPPRK